MNAVVAVTCMLAFSTASAGTIYTCTNVKGQKTFQQEPCPKSFHTTATHDFIAEDDGQPESGHVSSVRSYQDVLPSNKYLQSQQPKGTELTPETRQRMNEHAKQWYSIYPFINNESPEADETLLRRHLSVYVLVELVRLVWSP